MSEFTGTAWANFVLLTMLQVFRVLIGVILKLAEIQPTLSRTLWSKLARLGGLGR